MKSGAIDPTTIKNRLLRSALTFAAILILLSTTTAYMVWGLYRTSSLLTESNKTTFILETKNKTSILDEYFRQRIADLTELSRLNVLQIYFERKSLNLPVEQGIDVISGQIEQELILRRLEVEEYGRSVYAGSVFFDLESGQIAARTGHSPKSRWITEDLLSGLAKISGKDVNFGSLCGDKICRLYVYTFVKHGGRPKGLLFMELSTETILGKIQLPNLQQINDFSGIINSSGNLIIGPENLLGTSIEHVYGISTKTFNEPTQIRAKGAYDENVGAPVTIAGRKILNTDFYLVQIAPEERFSGGSSPVLLGLVFLSLMVGLVIMLTHVLRSYVQRQIMFQHLQEAHDHLELRVKERTAELQESNENLELEVLERTRAETALRRATQELEEINKELKQFAHVVSHDLKAPLRAAGYLVTWLTKDYAGLYDEKGKEYLDLLSSRINRMHDLIEGILQYSQMGRLTDITEIDLNKLVREVIDFIGIPENISIKIDSELPIIRGDKTSWHAVFQNLIDNAVKYMDKPKGEITIGCVGENSHWLLSVKDNGPGIEKKHFERIFEIFQTIHSSEGIESSGIGLSLVKKIVELHGGKIWLESVPGSGTTFCFTIPAGAVSV